MYYSTFLIILNFVLTITESKNHDGACEQKLPSNPTSASHHIRNKHETSHSLNSNSIRAPTALIQTADRLDRGALNTLKQTLINSGWQVDTETEEEPFDFNRLKHYDLIWSHNGVRPYIWPHLSGSQRYNHVQEQHLMTNKLSLAVRFRHPAIPRSFYFTMPNHKQQFLEHSEEHPEEQWLRKSFDNKQVELLSREDLLQDNAVDEKHFVQQFIPNPMLIDGRKYDLAMYVLVTSIRPLRVYIWDSELLFRAAPKEYHPFDPNDQSKYVANRKNDPKFYLKRIFEIPSLLESFAKRKLSSKYTIFEYLDSKGINSDEINEQMKKIILEIMFMMRRKFQDKDKNQGPNSSFELTRFDFLVDDLGKVHLIEVNMSPVLHTNAVKDFVSDEYKKDDILHYQTGHYTKLHKELFAITGIDRCAFCDRNRTKPVFRDATGYADIYMPLPFCTSKECKTDNKPAADYKCLLCANHMPKDLRDVLKEVWREQMNRIGFRRSFPPPPVAGQTLNELLEIIKAEETLVKTSYSDFDKLQRIWIHFKCKYDRTWCT